MTDTTTDVKPLSPAEQKMLSDLTLRANAGKAPAVRIGEPYQALIPLSVPRRGDPTHQTDLVMPGETVYLTDDEAESFNRHGSRDGRQIEVLRKLDGPAGNELIRVRPAAVSGRINQPPPPPPGSDAARPDPAGSTHIMTMQIPESGEPQAGSENDGGDAADLPPGTRISTEGTDAVRRRSRAGAASGG
jgi:hypothetical protein